MRIGYLMATYPMVSTTFIGREIEALERLGFAVDRFAVRHWEGTLVDPLDLAEAQRTDYLLDDGGPRLLLATLAEAATHPRGFLRALGLWRRLLSASGFGLGGLVRHAAYLMEAAALRRRLRRTPVAHLHAHFSTNTAAVAMLCRALGGPGYSFTVHGPDELFDPVGASLGLKIEHAAFVACISHFCRSQCMIFAPVSAWDRLRIIHCGVRPAGYAPAGGPPARVGGKRILYVGRLSLLKGGLVLVEALSRLVARHPDAELVVIGDGEARAPMQARAEALGVAGAIRFEGFRRQDEVRAALAEADLLTLPSFAEGVPVVLMEAMAAGLPVVATQVAGVSELVADGRSGRVVPPGDAEALAEALDALLSDPALRARMGAEGIATVAADFDLDAEAARLATLIAAAAAGEPLPPALRPDPLPAAP
ncbi:glycosyltransferase [Albimonas sp. CAU 1670]|uniref:glycosyltransferase n=1 Tax=Albimonas sp. CAU 1670 TaxID=3032599 RepID=UPI0023DB22A2|nr:glycosyltransferase [Albimonas sp. CAU 1670]MDF2231621.1 glycosyltransferase [Albimonas sp. CAU 1670]